MSPQSLIHLAILAYFLVPSALGGKFELHTGQKAVGKVEKKVVIRRDNARRITFKPDSRGRTPNDFFDDPELQPLRR